LRAVTEDAELNQFDDNFVNDEMVKAFIRSLSIATVLDHGLGNTVSSRSLIV